MQQPAPPQLPGWQFARPTVHYVMQTEVHVYAFSMAANALLAFFPFLIVMVSICRYFLNWPAAENVIYLAVHDVFAGETGDFLVRNLRAAVNQHGNFRVIPLLLLLFTANGIFEPLEVALNRAWGINTNRSYFRNQLISLGLIFVCGGLALIPVILPALAAGDAALAIYKVVGVQISILILMLIYWALPNGKVPVGSMLPAAIIVGAGLEMLKYLNLLVWPYLRAKFEAEYSVFVNSVTIVFWSFLASMMVLAGAEWAARRSKQQEEE